ncbi:hypothetical protein H2203_004115 [Taxawa tesnikishii (nom. ined.)]|nr:hypothetical protein H2203_004115 [Dothideales sp. JES 119]
MDVGATEQLRPPHPRRPPARMSVSLLHSPRPAMSKRFDSKNTNPSPKQEARSDGSSPSSLKPALGKDDSGESSNADKWFEKSNNEVSQSSTGFVDNEKLFEVRVHGLKPEKKRELEDMLRKFALGLSHAPDESPANAYERVLPTLTTQKTASSQGVADSAYVSASGNGASSAQSESGGGRSQGFAQSAASRQQNIQSYLHDIPEGLLPSKNPAVMSEKDKKKHIVRRLEAIFAGKGAATANDQQTLQQQEVSQNAAKADRSEIEARGQRAGSEGLREARIMNKETEDPLDPNKEGKEMVTGTESIQGTNLRNKVDQQDFANESPEHHYPEQRPTRPLDLDPQRAQIPAENMQYIQNLGFSPPDFLTMEKQEDGHGWIYLNLLANMAQLHTLNIEMSQDGRKVRWKGGKDLTRQSDDGADTPAEHGKRTDSSSPRKRMKRSHSSKGALSEHRAAGQKCNLSDKPDNKFLYTPMFYHRSSTEDSDSSSAEEEDTDSGIRTATTKRSKKRDDGPIIFYNNARFCIDLSGDSKTQTTMLSDPIIYNSISSQPVGIAGPPAPASLGSSEKRGPLAQVEDFPEPMDLDDNPIPASMEVTFPAQTPLSSSSSTSQGADFRKLEVSGVGGVYPADNFAIKVQSRHARLDNETAPETVRRDMPVQYPNRLASILRETGSSRMARSAFHKEVLSLLREDLPPSELPPASMYMALDEDSSCEDDDSDAASEMSILPAFDDDAPPPSAAPQTMDMAYASSDESDDESEEYDEDSDDGSVDFLAPARKIDPQTIMAQEREYDANMAERLAEEIPAGSSAATAGGGSGFASPASGVGDKEYEKARKQYREAQASSGAPKTPSLKRARTSDNGC